MLALLPDFDMTKLTIIDQSDLVEENCVALHTARARGATFLHTSVTRDNWRALLADHLSPGDTVIDLTFGISSIDVLEWCQNHRVCYINTAIERWEDELIPNNEAKWIADEKHEKDWTVSHKELYDRTLYARHLEIANKDFSENGPTAVLEHGNSYLPSLHFSRLPSL
jgi:homospermidine synthase